MGGWRAWAGERAGEWIAWAAAGAILVGFALWQLGTPNGDLYQYRCFALAFWRGSAATVGLTHCAGRLPAGTFPPFHVLPREYPPLALLVFSAPLLLGGTASMTLYVLAFNALMLACLGATAWLLRGAAPANAGSAGRATGWYAAGWYAAGWYALWLALGSTTIALARYDAVPALLTGAAIVRARRGPSRTAYVLLAIGALLKLYPLLLLVLLAVWDWRRTAPPAPPRRGEASQKPLSPWGRGWGGVRRRIWLAGPALAAAIIVTIQAAADALTGAWGVPWLAVQGARPPQIESTAAGLLWLVELAQGRGGQVHAVTVERALALVGAPGGALATATLCLALAAIAWAAWALATGRIAPDRALAGSLLALLGGAAVFSPQYLIWATPLVALALISDGGSRHTDAAEIAVVSDRHTDTGGPNATTATVHGPARTPAINGRDVGPVATRTHAIIRGWSLVCAATTLLYSVGYLLGWPQQTGWALAPFMALVLLRDGAVWVVAALLLRPTPRAGKPPRVPAGRHAKPTPISAARATSSA